MSRLLGKARHLLAFTRENMERNRDYQLHTANVRASFPGELPEELLNYEEGLELINSFSKVVDLYCVMLDSQGRIANTPQGPATNLGDFYDLFENPDHYALKDSICKTDVNNREPVIFSWGNGQFGNYSAAPFVVGDKVLGFWVLAAYTTEEIEYLQNIYEEQYIVADIVSAGIYSKLKNYQVDEINRVLLNRYNEHDFGIFIRMTNDGHVLFANDKMNEMMGCNFVGGDSREILTDLHDRFDHIRGMRSRSITKEKVTRWTSYIQKLDAIFDITEIQLNWKTDVTASLILLKRAKEK